MTKFNTMTVSVVGSVVMPDVDVITHDAPSGIQTAKSVDPTAFVRNAILFNQGGHSSLLDSTVSPAVAQEMQTEIASFINTNGLNLTIENKSVITTTP